jgi:hypothetical protein
MCVLRPFRGRAERLSRSPGPRRVFPFLIFLSADGLCEEDGLPRHGVPYGNLPRADIHRSRSGCAVYSVLVTPARSTKISALSCQGSKRHSDQNVIVDNL